MGKDYYAILDIPRDATEAQIKKAYKRKAMEHHPDRNINNQEEAEIKFKEVAEAYEVLNDPQKRSIYDRYGEDGLKNAPNSNYHYRPTNADDIFKSFFGTSNFDDLFSNFGFTSSFSSGGFGGHSPFQSQFFTSSFGGGDPFASSRTYIPTPQSRTRKAKDKIYPLQLSLEELFYGGVKNHTLIRKLYDAASNSYVETAVELNIQIVRGWRPGSKITFPDLGDESPNYLPGDVVFVVEEIPHKLFTRKKNDLILTLNISLKEALMGKAVSVLGIDGNKIKVCWDEVVHPGYFKCIESQGMPSTNNPNRRGDLFIEFNVSYPKKLDKRQKQLIDKAL